MGARIMPPSTAAQKMHEEQNQSRDEAGRNIAADITGFNYNGDIEAVAAHFEKFLKPLGWKRLKPLYVPDAMAGAIEKVYFDKEKRTEIKIADWALINAQNNDVQGKARFVLTIIRGKLRNPATGGFFPETGGDEALEDL